MRGLTIVALATLAACTEAPSEQAEAPEPAAADEPEATGPEFEFTAMAQPGYWAMLIPEGADAEQIELAAREQCGTASSCSVLGWTDERYLARAMPMTDREVDQLAVSYQLNRASGHEQLMWDCDRFAQEDPAACIEG